MSKKPFIDSHQHVWKISEREYSWITPDIAHLLGKDFEQHLVNPLIKKFGITGTMYVQAADTYEDTFYMFASAAVNPEIIGIVGWVPLDRTQEAISALNLFGKNSLFRGVRNLTHDYGNPKYQSDDAWILRPQVLQTLDPQDRVGGAVLAQVLARAEAGLLDDDDDDDSTVLHPQASAAPSPRGWSTP